MPIITAAVISAVGAAAGAAISSSGAKKNAKAQQRAAFVAGENEKAFTNWATQQVQGLETKEQGLFSNLDQVLKDYGSGIFGKGTGTLQDLRSAQGDFAQLAAGDYRGFESSVRLAVSNALTGSFGGPLGSFNNVAARNIMDLRQIGVNNSTSLGDKFNTWSTGLAGMQFGIWDQSVTNQIKLKQASVAAQNNYLMGSASQEGIDLVSAGSAVAQASRGIAGIYSAINTQNQIDARSAASGNYQQAINPQRNTDVAYNYNTSNPFTYSDPVSQVVTNPSTQDTQFNLPANAAPLYTAPPSTALDYYTWPGSQQTSMYNNGYFDNILYQLNASPTVDNTASDALLPSLQESRTQNEPYR